MRYVLFNLPLSSTSNVRPYILRLLPRCGADRVRNVDILVVGKEAHRYHSHHYSLAVVGVPRDRRTRLCGGRGVNIKPSLQLCITIRHEEDLAGLWLQPALSFSFSL